MTKVLCALCDSISISASKTYACDSIPHIHSCSDSHMLLMPTGVDFRLGQLLASLSGVLRLGNFLKSFERELVVTSVKGAVNSRMAKVLPEPNSIISQPFLPDYLAKGRFCKAKKCKKRFPQVFDLFM